MPKDFSPLFRRRCHLGMAISIAIVDYITIKLQNADYLVTMTESRVMTSGKLMTDL